MTVTVDSNILLDVFLKRQPFFGASSAVLDLVSCKVLRGICASHGLTTIYYLLRKAHGSASALSAVDQLLGDFVIAGLDQQGWIEARRLAFKDFEDSAVAQIALEEGSSWIITRNTADFETSPVPAINPSEFLLRFFPSTPFS